MGLSAGVAQLVEQLICNQQAVGSSPSSGLGGRECLLEIGPELVGILETN
jgi:hypothetical protein